MGSIPASKTMQPLSLYSEQQKNDRKYLPEDLNMDSRQIVPVGLSVLLATTGACATPSIDFVNRDGSAITYRSVECIAKHGNGHGITSQGLQDSGASVIKLKDLLAGASGSYQIQCNAVRADSSEVYTALFEAVKVPKAEPGSEAREYDERGFGYGIKIPYSQTRTACYDRDRRVFQQECLNRYYGSKLFYLESVAGKEDIRYKYRTEYSSNIGVFLNVNPRGRNSKEISSRTERAAPL